MRRFSISVLTLFAILSFALLSAPSADAQADAMARAKEAKQIGERFDGFLGVVDPGASTDINALVESINAKRKEKYREIARRNAVSAAEVARIAGAKLINQTPTGQYVMPRDEEWVLK